VRTDKSTADTFVKTGAAGRSDFYPVEAAGLRWLAEAGPSAARVVAVLEVSTERLFLERLVPTRPTRAAAEAFGRALAATHASGAAAFGQPPNGWSGDGYIGQQAQTNIPTPTWGTFYAAQRMLPFARRARELGHLSTADASVVDRVAERLVNGNFDDDTPPARIHGDLWAGNVVFTDSGVVLIDPAAHGGHRLTDLAMLHLFGTPELRTITAAYAEAAALDPGWESLIGLHQLHPLLVHAVSHGRSYGAEAGRIAARYA
jgi:fructosamine-3-kinase